MGSFFSKKTGKKNHFERVIFGNGTVSSAKLGGGIVDDAEFNFLDGVTSGIQAQFAGVQGQFAGVQNQLNGKAPLNNATLGTPTLNTPQINSPTLSGFVGIGGGPTATAQLHVHGTAGAYVAGALWGYTQGGPVASNTPGTIGSISIYANGGISAVIFRAFSDSRIKNIEGLSDSGEDLKTLNAIEITNYTHKDTIAKGSQRSKKVIAQQVEKVFPEAVSKSTDTIPDIYRPAEVELDWVKLQTDLKKGDRVRLIEEKKAGVYEVLEVREGAFRTTLMPAGKTVFVFGREVDDFRSVDYEAIAMLNVSATQEIYRESQALKKKVNAMEARLIAMEKLLKPAPPVSASVVSLESEPVSK